jgi:hypothetical protein
MNCHEVTNAFVVRGDKNLVARVAFAHAECAKRQENGTKHEIGDPHRSVMA